MVNQKAMEMQCGQLKEYSANVIAENMLRQIDHEGIPLP